jgi:hypothetical protein
MIRIKILVEGQTEETFVRNVLAPLYVRQQIFITPIIVLTSPGHKGGVTSYGKVKHQLIRLCRQDRGAVITTMLDLYGLPSDFPGKQNDAYPINGSGEQKAAFLEERMGADIGEENLIPYFSVHEFEALLFVEPGKFADWIDDEGPVEQLSQIKAQAGGLPEQINDNPNTAPSKRILALVPHYKKPLHGPLIAEDIGLDAMRHACPHFNDWLQRLDQLAI